ncbi:FliI/YscN family ATPase [Endozoicomonas sp. SM1973]|uniref:protein-secreting ATPase n=1 Tax=Spartinivicinus marinus TaxID=2994442 RepID=A0A853ILX7_9GAMM|nr:FliI/YscN family ATPase [Spartinivicinus marinus]MCX4029074.1 FliI/YscN family ATPase [Spartinivicinus marinus]NYZ68776.1 FliI/YscN family ATPase [Spartinivicinus marinus]
MLDQYFSQVLSELNQLVSYSQAGAVTKVSQTTIETGLVDLKLGELCKIIDHFNQKIFFAEVISVEQNKSVLAPTDHISQLSLSAQVVKLDEGLTLQVSSALFGKVIDYRGEALNCIHLQHLQPTTINIEAKPPSPWDRQEIDETFETGVRAIDGLSTCGVGQRLGIFAAAGVGKSTLLAMLIAHAKVDLVIIALIGERGREVKDFVNLIKDTERINRTIIVCATSDKTPLEQVKAANSATRLAEHYRDQGLKVLLLFDSLTRYARAQRMLGLMAGEPPARGGYPPSVFLRMAQLVERPGKTNKGSITAFYTVLMEGDNPDEPVADEARSLLDGHLILSRQLSEKGHYPAIDVLRSKSRLMVQLVNEQQLSLANTVTSQLSMIKENEFIIRVGEYKAGNDQKLDQALANQDAINQFLQQGLSEKTNMEETMQWLIQLGPQ